jgi:hypothetical protein
MYGNSWMDVWTLRLQLRGREREVDKDRGTREKRNRAEEVEGREGEWCTVKRVERWERWKGLGRCVGRTVI